MTRWYRVFGNNAVPPAPAALLEHLERRGLPATGRFRGDETGWFEAEIRFAAGQPLVVHCYRADEEGIRDELNTWAAWLETAAEPARAAPLMQHLIGTTHVFTLQDSTAAVGRADECPLAICLFLAQATDGVIQVDDHGFLDAQGALLVAEQ
jgi:hypothetical protein